MKHLFFFALTLGLALLAGSCKKDSKNDDPTSEAEFYFQCKIDGQPVLIEWTTTNEIEIGNSNGGSIDPPHCSFDYGSFIGIFDPNPGLSGGIDFLQFFDGDCGDEEAVFNTLFPTGTYPFVDAAIGGKGVDVNYTDGVDYYRSMNGAQTGSHFAITKSEAANDAFGLGQTITGTMECTLYSDTGGSVELTEGQFKLHFREY